MKTGYKLFILNFLKKAEERYRGLDDRRLLLHQYLVQQYFCTMKIRGLLLLHETGTGKTFTAVGVCEQLLPDVDGIILLMKKSLHENFRKTVLQYTGSEEIDKKYSFVSANASNMIDQIYRILGKKYAGDMSPDLLSLNGYLLVADEAHHIFASVTNGSRNAVELYKLVMKSDTCRILFMSGSPIVKECYESGICFNMLKGLIGRYTLFGENYDEFNRYFIQDSDALNVSSPEFFVQIKNTDVYGDRITGLVSYYEPDKEMRETFFPRFYGPYVINIRMSDKQYALYQYYRIREKKVESKTFQATRVTSISMPKQGSSTYRVMSRQISNYVYPEHCTTPGLNEIGETVYEFDPECLKSDDFTPEMLKDNPKLLTLLSLIKGHCPEDILPDVPPADLSGLLGIKKLPPIRVGPVIVYSQYLKFGLTIIAKALDAYGFENISTGPAKGKPRYGILSGAEDVEDQTRTLNLFTSDENMYGSVIRILLISQTASEGIDTSFVAGSYIYEPHWHNSRHDQVFARSIRWKSHFKLPKEEQNLFGCVLLSNYPDSVKTHSEPTTDYYLWNKSQIRKNIINDFLDVIKKNAVDCGINYPEKEQCRICAESDDLLIVPDIHKHIEYGSKCIVHEEHTVEATPFIYNGQEYFYSIDGDIVHIYQYDMVYEQYIEIMLGHPDYYSLLNEVRTF